MTVLRRSYILGEIPGGTLRRFSEGNTGKISDGMVLISDIILWKSIGKSRVEAPVLARLMEIDFINITKSPMITTNVSNERFSFDIFALNDAIVNISVI